MVLNYVTLPKKKKKGKKGGKIQIKFSKQRKNNIKKGKTINQVHLKVSKCAFFLNIGKNVYVFGPQKSHSWKRTEA